jgi:hypothetical protein
MRFLALTECPALERPFLKKSGWRKIVRAFNLSFERVRSEVERDEQGGPVRAEVWVRAVAPNGQFGDGDGYCSVEDPADEPSERVDVGRGPRAGRAAPPDPRAGRRRAFADSHSGVPAGTPRFVEAAPDQ